MAAWLLDTWVRPLHAVVKGDLHGDSSLLTWNIWNVTESVLRGRNPYDCPILYFPVGANLTTHTYAPGFLPVGLIFRAVEGANPCWPIAAYRATIWLSFTLGLFATYHSLRSLGAGGLPAAAGSLGFTFAAAFRSRALETHLVALTFLLPTLVLALAGSLRSPTPRSFAWLGATAAGCVYFSEYYTPFLWLGLVIVALGGLAWRDTRRSLGNALRAAGTSGVGAGLAAFVLLVTPFLANWHPRAALRFREEQASFESANLAGFAVPDPTLSPLYARTVLARMNDKVRRGSGGAQVFLGLPVLFLAFAGALRLRGPRVRLLGLTAVSFLVLSLGPELKVFGENTELALPYRLLMRIPPFDLARAPARLAAVGLFGCVGLMGLALTETERRLGAFWGRILCVAILGWSLAEVVNSGPDVGPFSPPPELQTLSPGGVLDLPISVRDSLAMLLQVIHGRPIVTGYVSRVTREQSEMAGRLDTLLREDPRGFALALRRIGVTNVLATRGTSDETLASLAGAPLNVVDLRDLE